MKPKVPFHGGVAGIGDVHDQNALLGEAAPHVGAARAGQGQASVNPSTVQVVMGDLDDVPTPPFGTNFVQRRLRQ